MFFILRKECQLSLKSFILSNRNQSHNCRQIPGRCKDFCIHWWVLKLDLSMEPYSARCSSFQPSKYWYYWLHNRSGNSTWLTSGPVTITPANLCFNDFCPTKLLRIAKASVWSKTRTTILSKLTIPWWKSRSLLLSQILFSHDYYTFRIILTFSPQKTITKL